MISRNWFWMIYFKLYKLSTESVDGSLMKLSLAVVKVADDVRGHSTDSLIHKDHVDVVTVALIHFVALIHGWFTADSHWFTDSHWFCGLDSHWFILWPWFTLIHWFRMLFCGLDSLIQDAVFVALIHWQGMMSWNSDNFDNSALTFDRWSHLIFRPWSSVFPVRLNIYYFLCSPSFFFATILRELNQMYFWWKLNQMYFYL